jgi:hypothetical protein
MLFALNMRFVKTLTVDSVVIAMMVSLMQVVFVQILTNVHSDSMIVQRMKDVRITLDPMIVTKL